MTNDSLFNEIAQIIDAAEEEQVKATLRAYLRGRMYVEMYGKCLEVTLSMNHPTSTPIEHAGAVAFAIIAHYALRYPQEAEQWLNEVMEWGGQGFHYLDVAAETLHNTFNAA